MGRSWLSALLACAFLGLCASPARPADDVRALWRENRSLKTEAALAATQKPYFVLDLEKRLVSLRTRAMVLLEIPVVELGIWGRRPAIGATSIEKRDALARPAINPGDEKTLETLDQQLLELIDMPTAYHLRLAGDVDVEVLPAAEGGWPRWRQRAGVWRWRLTRPLVTLRQRRDRHETTSILLVLRPADARQIYWSLFEGLDGILIPP